MNRPFARRSSGFTLVEILLVLVVAAVIMSLGAGILSGLRGAGLDDASLQAGSLCDNAQRLAQTKGARVRILVHDDSSEPEYFRRRLLLVREDASSAVWIPDGAALDLPAGIYLDEPASTSFGPGLDAVQIPSGGGPEGSGIAWLHVEFNARGVCLRPGARFVFGEGILDESGSTVTITILNPARRNGFVFRRNGGVSPYETPEQL